MFGEKVPGTGLNGFGTGPLLPVRLADPIYLEPEPVPAPVDPEPAGTRTGDPLSMSIHK